MFSAHVPTEALVQSDNGPTASTNWQDAMIPSTTTAPMSAWTASPQPGARAAAVVAIGADLGRAVAAALAAQGLPCHVHASVAGLLGAGEPATAGCLVLDLGAADAPAGVALAETLAREGRLPPLVARAGSEPRLVRRLLQAGACDVLDSGATPADCLAAILASVARTPAPRLAPPPQPGVAGRLTPRQAEVLAGIVEGLLNKQIAHRLGISVRTVEIHRAQLMARCGARGVAELMRMALGQH